MTKLLSFEDAIIDSNNYSKRHLILGNGFSIGCFPDIFQYSTLFNQADFSDTQKLKKVFEAFSTKDFEIVINALENSVNLLSVYLISNQEIIDELKYHAEKLKEILVQTISNNHPHTPDSIDNSKYYYCRKFLNYFLGKDALGQVYTLNYDLLLYWVLMHTELNLSEGEFEIDQNDGFGNEENEYNDTHVVWQGYASAGRQRVHFVHGALHLYGAGYTLKKYTWNRSGASLISQIRKAIENSELPLFVAEGSSEQKKQK